MGVPHFLRVRVESPHRISLNVSPRERSEDFVVLSHVRSFQRQQPSLRESVQRKDVAGAATSHESVVQYYMGQ